MRRFFWIAGALAAAGIVHILAVLAIPQLAEHDAWKRLSALLKPNTLAFADAKNAPHLPFTPPDLITAYCLFDISEHNVIVEAPLPEAPWSVAVTARSGENFYVITGADAKKPVVRLLIIPHDRLPEESSTEETVEGGNQNIIVSPSPTGIVAIRAPIRGESFRALALQELRKARCEIQKPAEPVVAAATEPPPPAAAKRAPEQSQVRRRPRRRRGRHWW